MFSWSNELQQLLCCFLVHASSLVGLTSQKLGFQQNSVHIGDNLREVKEADEIALKSCTMFVFQLHVAGAMSRNGVLLFHLSKSLRQVGVDGWLVTRRVARVCCVALGIIVG